jgi:hypothetical protein
LVATMLGCGRYQRTRIALTVAGLLLVGGCAPTIHLPIADTSLPSAFEVPPTSADAATISLDRWWDHFSDPQLSSLVGTALDRSTTARLAYARIAEARAVRNQARASTLPSGNLGGDGSEQGSQRLGGNGIGQGANTSFQANFAPSWEIDLFGRLATTRYQRSSGRRGPVGPSYAHGGQQKARGDRQVIAGLILRDISGERGRSRARAARGHVGRESGADSGPCARAGRQSRRLAPRRALLQ